ncbi:MAG: DNA recombination protein RmuC [Myxococcales bacterium]|nr:DNA recombination protein RmuC [Myxococcales bacterium]
MTALGGIVVLVLGLVAGALLGRHLASREDVIVKERWRAAQERVDALTLELREQAASLSEALLRNASLEASSSLLAERAEAAAQRAEGAELRLHARSAELERANLDLAAARTRLASAAQLQEAVVTAREGLQKEFEATGARVLALAQEQLVTRAHARLSQSEEASALRLQGLLAPVDERLRSYEEQVRKLEAQRVDAFGQLAGLLTSLREGQERVRAEAEKLGRSLTNAPKARGRWGERALQNVLEQCGLSEHTDFNLEQTFDGPDGLLRPDAIVRIPGQKRLIIDAKVSLNAYQAAFETDDPDERLRQLDAHARSMRGHVLTLGNKSYQDQLDEAPDYVVMFVPGEQFVSAALEQDPTLWDFAFQHRVLIATPTNLVAIARTVALVWKQDQVAREAVEIGRAGAELYDRLAVAAEHLQGVGKGLDRAVRKYNDFVGSFERNVLASGRRLREKGIQVGKRSLGEIPQIDTTPRYGGVLDEDEADR